jgi:hypothetical protein
MDGGKARVRARVSYEGESWEFEAPGSVGFTVSNPGEYKGRGDDSSDDLAGAFGDALVLFALAEYLNFSAEAHRFCKGDRGCQTVVSALDLTAGTISYCFLIDRFSEDENASCYEHKRKG